MRNDVLQIINSGIEVGAFIYLHQSGLCFHQRLLVCVCVKIDTSKYIISLLKEISNVTDDHKWYFWHKFENHIFVKIFNIVYHNMST